MNNPLQLCQTHSTLRALNEFDAKLHRQKQFWFKLYSSSHSNFRGKKRTPAREDFCSIHSSPFLSQRLRLLGDFFLHDCFPEIPMAFSSTVKAALNLFPLSFLLTIIPALPLTRQHCRKTKPKLKNSFSPSLEVA